MTVEALPANQPETFYRGAGRIAAFRNVPELPRRPEDWVGSTTSRFGLAPSGLSALPDGRLLADAIAADPLWWLGPDRVDTGVLVKLLDAGQRLPLHAHPDRRFATEHLASPYGKTEAWVIVSARPDAYVHLGFDRDVSTEELAKWVADQDSAGMLAATNRIPVAAGDAILCPAGLPHAIGDGILLVEVQEPTDFSVLLEYSNFGLPDGHLGLGYDLALSCVDRSAWSPSRLAALRGAGSPSQPAGLRGAGSPSQPAGLRGAGSPSRPAGLRGAGSPSQPAGTGGGERLLPPAADEFFRASRHRGGDGLEQGFAVLVAVAGEGRLHGDHDDRPIRRGETLLIPYAAGPLRLDGPIDAIRLAAPA